MGPSRKASQARSLGFEKLWEASSHAGACTVRWGTAGQWQDPLKGPSTSPLLSTLLQSLKEQMSSPGACRTRVGMSPRPAPMPVPSYSFEVASIRATCPWAPSPNQSGIYKGEIKRNMPGGSRMHMNMAQQSFQRQNTRHEICLFLVFSSSMQAGALWSGNSFMVVP